MKKLYIRRASELVTCRGSAPKKGAEMADIGLIKNGGVLLHDDRIFGRRHHRGAGSPGRL